MVLRKTIDSSNYMKGNYCYFKKTSGQSTVPPTAVLFRVTLEFFRIIKNYFRIFSTFRWTGNYVIKLPFSIDNLLFLIEEQ